MSLWRHVSDTRRFRVVVNLPRSGLVGTVTIVESVYVPEENHSANGIVVVVVGERTVSWLSDLDPTLKTRPLTRDVLLSTGPRTRTRLWTWTNLSLTPLSSQSVSETVSATSDYLWTSSWSCVKGATSRGASVWTLVVLPNISDTRSGCNLFIPFCIWKYRVQFVRGMNTSQKCQWRNVSGTIY